jgi:hypothetical protein
MLGMPRRPRKAAVIAAGWPSWALRGAAGIVRALPVLSWVAGPLMRACQPG